MSLYMFRTADGLTLCERHLGERQEDADADAFYRSELEKAGLPSKCDRCSPPPMS